MKTIGNKTIFAALSAALLALLAACGDETTSTTAFGTENTVTALNKAGKCTEERTGETVYAEKEGMLYVCDGSIWVSMKGEDGKKGAVGDTGKVGDDTDHGKAGPKGASCTVKTADGATQLVCGSATYTISSEEGDAGVFTDKRDGKVYPWVKIGPFAWMAKNLDYGKLRKSEDDTLPDQKFSTMANVEKWCFMDSAAYCDTLGGYYQWANAMALNDSCNAKSCNDLLDTMPGRIGTKWLRHQGICPEGWHIPSNREFRILKTFADSVPAHYKDTVLGGKALATTSGRWFDGQGTDYFGFNAVPSSVAFLLRMTDWDESVMSNVYAFMSATEYNGSVSYSWGAANGIGNQLNAYDAGGMAKKGWGYTIRCVRDWEGKSIDPNYY